MKTRLSKSQALTLKMIPKTYSLLSRTFKIRWSEVDGLVEDLSLGRWSVVRWRSCWCVGGRWVDSNMVGGPLVSESFQDL